MHKIQIAILYKLRHKKSARFSDLMQGSGLESDVFKFHIQKLVKLLYVHKLPTGEYVLTSAGKEFANNLDDEARTIQKQPKLSILLVVAKPNVDGEQQYLLQKRARSPYYGFWGCISGPVQWGEDFEEAAARELKKQTGLVASFSVQAFCRLRDYDNQTKRMLEDKLFVILVAHDIEDDLTNTWAHGINQWMTRQAFTSQAKYFKSSSQAINMINKGEFYASEKAYYDEEDY